jgi:hypothetical protein
MKLLLLALATLASASTLKELRKLEPSLQFHVPPAKSMLVAPGRPIVIANRPLAVDTDGPGEFPRDRDHQRMTAYEYANGTWLDARVIRYVVLPVRKGWKFWEELRPVRVGDYACVEYAGKKFLAVAGDTGPNWTRRGNFGEGSLKLAQDLDAATDEDHGIEDGVTFTFYPGSNALGAAKNQETLLRRMDDAAAKYGCR